MGERHSTGKGRSDKRSADRRFPGESQGQKQQGILRRRTQKGVWYVKEPFFPETGGDKNARNPGRGISGAFFTPQRVHHDG